MMSSQNTCSTVCSRHCSAPSKFQLPASPCPELLLTNSVPSDVQLNEIHSFVGSTKAHFSILDDQIAQAQRTLVRLKSQRAELADLVESHRGVVSAMRRLPRDILGEIFSQYLGASSDSHLHSPKALSHLIGVCAQWRATALASPLLWRHICPIRQNWNDSGELQQISLQLQRSAPVALSIHLDENASSRVVDLLLTESSRWKNLYLDFYSYNGNLTSSTLASGFPALEKLTLVILGPNLPDSEGNALFFESLPAMVELTLDANQAPIPGTLDFIWAQLRTCTLSDCSTADILHVLPLFSTGTQVCLEDFDEGPEQLTSVHTVVSDLSIRCHDGIDNLLSCLTAPCLKKFRIAGHFSIPPITAFLDRSSCALTHLGISLWDYSVNELTLLSSPHVRDIVDLDVDTHAEPWMLLKLIEMLVARDIMITPKLRRLTLRNCDWDDEMVANVFEIHASRRPVLRSLWLDRGGLFKFSQDTLQAALKSCGLEVVVFE